METLTANPAARARPLHEVCEDARQVDCGVCVALSGGECVYTTAPVSLPVTASTPLQPRLGYHVGRFGTAMKAGRISGPDLVSVLQTAVVFTAHTVIWDGENPRDNEVDETCPRCGAVSWGMTPDGLPECTQCLWPGGAS